MIIDIVVAVVVLASALISFMRGFIREVLTIAGVVGGILAAVFMGPVFAPVVRDWFGVAEGSKDKLFDIIPMEIVADATAYGVIFIAVVIVLSVLSHFISGAVKAMGLGPVDRTLGVLFGIARGLVLVGLFYLPFHVIMKQDKKEEFFKDSGTYYYLEKISGAMAQYLPESDDVKKTVDEKTDDLIKKKLEDQHLLGGDTKTDESAPETAKPEEKGEGYKDDQREKLDKLFNEPAINQ
jgi:membrane protein required for colicin V production